MSTRPPEPHFLWIGDEPKLDGFLRRAAEAALVDAIRAEEQADAAAAEWNRTARLAAAGFGVGTALAAAWDHAGVAAIAADLVRWWLL